MDDERRLEKLEEERSSLAFDLDKLNSFLIEEEDLAIRIKQHDLLVKQQGHMQGYLETLDERIAVLKGLDNAH